MKKYLFASLLITVITLSRLPRSVVTPLLSDTVRTIVSHGRRPSASTKLLMKPILKPGFLKWA